MERRKIALLVATDRYQDAGLSRLAAPASDARKLAAVLSDPAIAGFEVTQLHNRPNADVGKAIGNFYRDRRRDDLTLLYFTGHGIKDDYGQLYLAMTDTDRDNLPFTGVRGEQIRLAMEGCRSRQNVLILDCCYAGAFPAGSGVKGDAAVHALEQLSGRGSVVLTSSDATQYSFEGNQLTETGLSLGSGPTSLFTRFLIEGLSTGRADLDGDGNITLDELYSYVHDRVIEEQPQQRPKKKEDVEGHILFAWNIHWTLPLHISNALSSAYAVTKLTALEELRGRYSGGNTIVQQRILQTVRELVEDDSKSVSDAASRFLSAVSEAGDKARREAEDKARREAEDKAGTSAAGEHEGVVTVESDAGSATNRVQAHIVPDVATEEEIGTHRKSIPPKTPDEGAAFTSPTLAEPSPVTTADAEETTEDREKASAGHSSRIPAVGSATQENKIPPDGSGTPGRQLRRLSGRARILIWAGAGIALAAVTLAAVLIPVLTSSHTTYPPVGAGNPTSSPGGAGNPAPSPRWPFREDFSTTANGWTTVSSAGRYSNGTYQISVRPSDAWGFAAPTGVPELNPAPQNITINASARQIAGGDNTFYGITCREDKSGENGYEFEINDNGSAYIDKAVGGTDNTLAQNLSPPVHANGTNQLQAACTSVGGQNAVHLVFWVNGTKVIDTTDRNAPIIGGRVGLYVATAADTGTVEAEFDNFVVTKV